MKTSPWETEIIQPISSGGNSTGKTKAHEDVMLHIRPILSSNPIPLLQGDDFRGRSCSAKGAHLRLREFPCQANIPQKPKHRMSTTDERTC